MIERIVRSSDTPVERPIVTPSAQRGSSLSARIQPRSRPEPTQARRARGGGAAGSGGPPEIRVVGVKAIVISEPGGPDVLQWQDVGDLTPGPGEVLIDVAASAVNRADVMQRQGHYPPPPGASPYPGLECSGRVAAVGVGRRRGFRRRRRGVCPAVRRRLCRAGHGARRPGAAGACGSRSRRCRRAARGRVHGLVERLHGRRAATGRDAARARRLVGHRHDGHPARQARRSPGRGDRGFGGEARALS